MMEVSTFDRLFTQFYVYILLLQEILGCNFLNVFKILMFSIEYLDDLWKNRSQARLAT